MSKVKVNCQECGNDFEVYPSRLKDNPKFCSKECKFKNIRERKTPNRTEIECSNCGKKTMIYNYRLKEAKNHFCSMKCHDDYRSKQVYIDCEECGIPFKVKISRLEKQNPRYCSMKCRDKAFRGENSPLYTMKNRVCKQCEKEFKAPKFEIESGKGIFCSKRCYYDSLELDRPSDSDHFYGSAFWIRLRNECYERDNHTCQECLKTNIELHAHHIFPRVFGGKDELDNLVSLCNSCHVKIEHKTRKKYLVES